ncbi:MarR family transcriptional regulator [Parasedimentitalea maritima]|uniref:MarR family transcriptional regulator n=1 Tax=Parasedimentitalea maritima TaxID=2578117 RepID=A0ABY2V666_9RHOB|nr:MarR family transcriptional regulator [Zongyanglinia marina]TLP69209.1 MarR family transcriptional regulator [Zongyanglinia marina]
MTNPNSPATASWIALFRAQKRARTAIDNALNSANLPPLEQYDVLWALEQAMPLGLRPYELEQAVLLPQHGISRLTSQMVKQDLLVRLPCPDDKRGFRLVPSDSGLLLRQRMWQIYQPIITEFFQAKLAPDEVQELMQLLCRTG